MSKEFCEHIDKLNSNIIILRKDFKKLKFKIKEGFTTFIVDLKKNECSFCNKVSSCSLKKCIHIYKLYYELYQLDINELQFLWVNDNDKKVKNKEDMVILSDDIECPICFDDAGTKGYNKLKVIHCLDCGKFYHNKCLEKSKKGIKCLVCTNNWLPDWLDT